MKIEDFAGHELEPLAALIIDVDEYLRKRQVNPVDVCAVLSVLTGIWGFRHQLNPASVKTAALFSIKIGAALEMLDQLKE